MGPTNTAPDQPVAIDEAAEAHELATLYFGLAEDVKQFRIDHSDELSDGEKERLDSESHSLKARANFFNAQAIGATLRSLQPSLAHLKKVTAGAQAAVKTLKKASNIIAIATAGVALGAAISSGDIGAVGAALTAIGKTVMSSKQNESSSQPATTTAKGG